MTFQTKINIEQGFGVPGDIHLDSPMRAESLVIDSKGAQKNLVGYAYTKDTATNIAQVGGSVASGRIFAGILANSKAYPLYPSEEGTLAPSLALPDHVRGDFVTMGDVVIRIKGTAKIGDFVVFDSTTGEISAVADKSNLGGKQLVPNAVIYRYPVTNSEGGLTVVRLTN